MDAQLASGVSAETSPTRRESPVQFKQRLVIAFVRRTDGLQILASDRTFPADHLFRPFRDGAPISFEPDIREHPRPAASWHALRYSEGRGRNRKPAHALRSTSGRATRPQRSARVFDPADTPDRR